MRAGLVLGAVWATKKSPALTGQSLLRVRCAHCCGAVTKKPGSGCPRKMR